MPKRVPAEGIGEHVLLLFTAVVMWAASYQASRLAYRRAGRSESHLRSWRRSTAHVLRFVSWHWRAWWPLTAGGFEWLSELARGSLTGLSLLAVLDMAKLEAEMCWLMSAHWSEIVLAYRNARRSP